MKYTMTAVLAAALTAIPSVIAAPAAVATLLPAKYTLKVSTPTSGTAIQNYLGQITRDDYAGQFLNIGPGSNQEQIPVVLFRDGDSGSHVENIDNIANFAFAIQPNSEIILSQSFYAPLVGLGQINGALVLNSGDGKGPQALWAACPSHNFPNLWAVNWASSADGCIPIALTVVPL
ncbi:hypothetical protein Q9L58_007737 [Maublancomyces gigas]|uniref:Uncharacterized protein n=1 Tax=Discina gigas TaxID=1032678 RepID=A0ABR3GBP4_9PEZI